MNAKLASAPGKIVLAGEYAVLHGYSAIAAAVDRRARVRVEASASSWIELVTRGYRDGRRRLRLQPDGTFDYPDGPPDEPAFALFELVWRSLRRGQAGGVEVTLDTADFASADGRKFGIGSSAALAVALCAALCDESEPATIAMRADMLHEHFQGGGSGVDIACAVHGGIVRFRRSACEASEAASSESASMSVRKRTTEIGQVSLPSGLHCAILWSGRPADTASRIAQLADSLKQRPGRASLDALGEQSEQVAACWRDGDAAALLSELAVYTERLSDLDRSHELRIFAGGHRALCDIAAAAGLVYKPCGAGGGDVGAAFALDAGALDEFVHRAAQRGAARLELELGAAGLRTTGK